MARIKPVLIVIIVLLALALVVRGVMNKQEPIVTDPVVLAPEPFKGMPIRYNGYYKNQRNEAIYLIRFFPEGRVVLINGTTEVEKDLPAFLIRETKGNPAIGLHNVMTRVEGDSIFFTTRPEKGEIDYSGKVMDGSMVHFKRYSHITGARQLMEYIFHPDSVPSK
jgi:hypothetical protein